MDIKEEYKKALNVRKRKERLEEQLKEINIDISALNTSIEAVQTSNKSDLSTKVLIFDDIKQQILDCMEELREYDQKVKEILGKAELNSNMYDVMFYKYILFKDVREIASKMHYTINWVNKIHGHALNKIRKISNSHKK